MKTVARDLLIFLVICGVAWSLTRVRLHAQQAERLRAQLVYTTDIERKTADGLLESLEKVGFLDGIPRTYFMEEKDNITELRVVADPSIIADPKVEALIGQKFAEVCQLALPDRLVTVSLTDTYLTPFHLVFEARQF